MARLDGSRTLWFPFDDSVPDDPGLSYEVEPVDGGLDVHVRTVGLARDLLLQPDRVHADAVVDQGFVTLLPGESTTFRVRAPAALDAGLVKAPWVLTELATVLTPREEPPS